ncbi:MAG: hypothetical protein ACOC2W_03900 [bacterium]
MENVKNETLWKSDNEKWIIKKDDAGRIVIIENSFYSHFPVIYDDNTIGYDNPFIIPNYVKKELQKIVNELN